MAMILSMSARRCSPLMRVAQPVRNSTGATFPAVKVGRPDVTELSRGQNKVREVAMSPAMQDNVTPTWCKGSKDGIINMVAVGFFCAGFSVMCRNVYDLCTDSHKIEGR